MLIESLFLGLIHPTFQFWWISVLDKRCWVSFFKPIFSISGKLQLPVDSSGVVFIHFCPNCWSAEISRCCQVRRSFRCSWQKVFFQEFSLTRSILKIKQICAIFTTVFLNNCSLLKCYLFFKRNFKIIYKSRVIITYKVDIKEKLFKAKFFFGPFLYT